MKRAEALRVLGVAGDTPRREVVAAFARLSAHLEARAARAADGDERRACREQVETLRLALDLPAPRVPAPARRTRIGVAAVGSAGAVLVAFAWWVAPRPAPAPPPPAAASAARVAPEPAAAPAPARVSVLANVPGASARLRRPDGVELATTAADGSTVEVPAGAVRLEVSHPDCEIGDERDLALAPGDERRIEAAICSGTGWLVVRSSQVGDELSVDGVALGPTGPRRHAVRVGRRSVEVTKPGFAPWSATTRIGPASETTLHARLVARPESVAARSDEPGGSRGWHATVSRSMVRRYDTDLSGLIDTEEEVAAVPCSEWRSLERSYETGGLSVPMTRLYGFDGSRWVKDALGIDLRMREGSYGRMRECGLR